MHLAVIFYVYKKIKAIVILVFYIYNNLFIENLFYFIQIKIIMKQLYC